MVSSLEQTDDETRLASWIRARYPYARLEPLTALKLQKLCFYAAGAAWALGCGDDLGLLSFRAWKHGPVLVSVWEAHRASGATPLTSISGRHARYSTLTEQSLTDALDVYGVLSAWRLREQSHLETPWQETTQGAVIPHARIRHHFAEKFATGNVRFPEYLLDVGQFALDGIAVRCTFDTLSALAAEVRRSHAEWRTDSAAA